MLKTLLALLLALVACPAQAQAQAPAPVRLSLPLRAVTLYPNGCELQHWGELALPAGLVEVRLAGLSPRLYGPSVQADVSGAALEGLQLMASAAPQPGMVPGTLTDSLRVAQETVQKLLNEQTANAAEKAFLEDNKRVSAGGAGTWLAEVQRGAAYYRTRMAALVQRDAELTARLPPQKKLAEALGQRAGQLPATAARPQAVVLRLNVARAATVRIEVSYQIENPSDLAGWQPEYELRVSESNLTQLRVVSRARLANNSGLAWRAVPVSLRTATPASDVSRPTLDPWGVGFGRAGNEGEGRLDDFAVKGPGTTGTAGVSGGDAFDLGTRLRLPAPVSLAANASQVFTLAEQTLPMRLEYLAVPKRTAEVFLVGKVAEWNRVNFLSETAEVFFRGTYVGTTALDTRAYTDTLEVSLGHDPQLQLTRTKREDVESPAGGSRKRTTLAYELNVKNNHSYPVRLRLLDQVPVAQEKEIAVKVLKTSGAQLDAASGKLTWLLTIAPGATHKFPFSFTVEAPADKPINLRRDRSVRSPKFR